MKICNQCILPETFPGIKFDDRGICNHCRRADSSSTDTAEQKAGYRDNLDKLITSVKGTAHPMTSLWPSAEERIPAIRLSS